MIWTVALAVESIGIYTHYTTETITTPYISSEFNVIAIEPEIVPIIESKSEKREIQVYILEVFGEVDGVNALVVARCESKFNPSVVGDTNLMSYDSKHDEMVGDSIGVFQIRTGGEGWNRARANGMSTDEFREHLKDYKNNVDYAKTIFDRQGFAPWTCKKDL